MPKLILSTCGTSLLTNIADVCRKLVIDHANVRQPEDIPEEERTELETLIGEMNMKLKEATDEEKANLSAEFNGLLRYYEGRINSGKDTHWLIATDTWLGKVTAKAIQAELERYGHQVEVKPIQDLRTNSLDEFRSAMAELARLCAQEVRGFHDRGWRVVFNLTGGFKSVQGFMQALGMLYADESVYVFEHTSELLRLPRLPIQLNAADLVREHQRVLRRLAVGMAVSSEEAQKVPDILLMEVGGQVTFSAWGEVIWAEAGRDLLKERLWGPVDDKLRFGRGFEKSVEKFTGDRLRMINERLAQLAHHLNTPDYNPRSLDFKPLKGKNDPWTHECDAWSDQDARRLFGHFEGGVYVVDALDKGLH
jgi:putative CRISPR-associated protein (TIGR02619 family)